MPTTTLANHYRHRSPGAVQYGTVIHWNPCEGAGLIKSDHGRTIWFDTMALCDNRTSLSLGEHVCFATNYARTSKYDMAIWVQAISPT